MVDLIIREINESEYSSWDSFVEKSKQGNIFSTTLWMQVLNKYHDGKSKLIGIFKSNQLVCGILLYERKKAFLDIMAYPPLTPFCSIIFEDTTSSRISKVESSRKKIIGILDEYLIKNYNFVALQLEPSIRDIRPFTWLKWASTVNYTYRVKLGSEKFLWDVLEKDAKYEINKAKKNGITIEQGTDINDFLRLYEGTFKKQNIKTPLDTRWIKSMFEIMYKNGKCRLYYSKSQDKKTISGSLVVWDNKRAYYLLAASKPSDPSGSNYLLLWKIINDMSKKCSSIDLVGANIPNIVKFKREFATNLSSYYTVEKYSSFIIKVMDKVYRKLA